MVVFDTSLFVKAQEFKHFQTTLTSKVLGGEVMRQLGNAVPAELGKKVGQSIFRVLKSKNT
jgi:site-specific DNA-cytosine methylase